MGAKLCGHNIVEIKNIISSLKQICGEQKSWTKESKDLTQPNSNSKAATNDNQRPSVVFEKVDLSGCRPQTPRGERYEYVFPKPDNTSGNSSSLDIFERSDWSFEAHYFSVTI